MVDTMGTGETLDGCIAQRPRSEALEIAVSADLEVVKQQARWWNASPKPQVEAHQSSVAEGVGGAASARVADGCNRVLGQELSPGKMGRRAEFVRAAKLDELGARKKFDLCGT